MSAAQIPVPQVVRHKLRAVRGRKRLLSILAGTALAAALFCGLLLAAMLLDWLITPFESAPRVLMTATVLLTGTAAWILWGLRPAVRKSPLPTVAGLVDSAVPELEERWTTIADLSQTKDPPEFRGSEALIGQVAGEAERMHELVRPQQIVNNRTLKRSLWGACGAVALLALFWMADREQASVLWQRFWSPTQPISLTHVSSPTAGAVVPRHEPVTITGALEGRLRNDASIWLRDQSGEVSQHAMNASGANAGEFLFPIDDVAEPVEFRIRSGDGQTPWHRIDVADRPRLTGIEFKLTPPAYSKLPVDSQPGLPRRTRALEGSTLEVAFTSSEPLREMSLVLDDETAIPLEQTAEGAYRFQHELTADFAFSPQLVSQHGLVNEHPPSCRIIVYRDQFPSVAIVSPTTDTTVRPDDELQVEFRAEDDFGISRAELVVTDANHPEDAPLKVIDIPLGEQQNQAAVQGSVPLDLKDFDLKQGANLSYSVRVFDTKDSTGETRMSPSSSSVAQQSDSQSQSQSQPSDSEQTANANSASPNGSNSESKPGDQQQVAQSDQAQSQDSQNQTAQSQDSQPQDADPQKSQSSSSSSSSQSSKLASRSNKDDDSPQGKMEGAPRPGDEMQRRALNLGQCSSCKPMNLKIDEWAGSFAGQQREKLEIAIEAYLERMEVALRDAEHGNQTVLDEVNGGVKWGDPQVVGARKAAGHLSVASDVAVDLAGTSAGTPYAFMGLQLQEIDERHIAPATGELQGVAQTPDHQRREVLQSSLFHIRQAREMLANLSRTYEGVKINHKIAEAMTHVKKMHQVFIEDTFKLLGSKRPVLNPKQRAFLELELDEEFRRKLKELLEKKRDVQAELAKVLAENPDLLRRYMSRARVDADSYRDQLTILARRQQTLEAETRTALKSPADAAAVQESQRARHALQAVEISRTAALMLENFETWLPRGLKLTDQDVAPVHRRYQELGITADRLAAAALEELARPSTPDADESPNEAPENAGDESAPSEEPVVEEPAPPVAPQLANRVYDLLGQLQTELPELTTRHPGNNQLTVQVTNRLAEIGKLTTSVSGWVRLSDAFVQGDQNLIYHVQQNDLTNDTAVLTNKIANVKASVSTLTDEIAEFAEELQVTLEDKLLVEQATAEEAFDERATQAGQRHQAQAVEHFAKAEEQMDRMMDAIIAHLDSLPVNTRPNLDNAEAPTLEELLALLENEKLAAEGLGIPCCRPNNLSIVRDWLSPGKQGGGGGMGAMTASGMLARTLDAQRRANRLQQNAEERQRRLAAQMEAEARQNNDGRPTVNPRWNTLQSRLDDSLKQVRGQSPPPKYRSAIELYFELISGVSPSDSQE